MVNRRVLHRSLFGVAMSCWFFSSKQGGRRYLYAASAHLPAIIGMMGLSLIVLINIFHYIRELFK